jgi:peptide/nickel transport system permease protein
VPEATPAVGLRRSPRLLRWGAGLCAGLALVAVAAPWLAPFDPAEPLDPAVAKLRPPWTVLPAIHLTDGTWRLADRVERVPGGLRIDSGQRSEVLPAGAVANLSPAGVADSRRFVLGTDRVGRDIWSRLLYGARISLAVGVTAVTLAVILGISIGAAAALGGRWLDALLMRFVDACLAFPAIFLVITLAALFKPGTLPMILMLGGTGWMGISRLMRAELLSLQQREFVLAARAAGLHPFAVFWRHLLPNALTPVVIQGALLVGNTILAESSLSFLGFGIQEPTPSWGNMVAQGADTLLQAWWISTFAGAAISLTVIAFNLLGDGLRDALDPRSRDLGPLAAAMPGPGIPGGPAAAQASGGAADATLPPL